MIGSMCFDRNVKEEEIWKAKIVLKSVSQMETISFASQPVMHLQKAGWKKEAKKKIL
jgi:hypothetical protein